MSGVTTDPTDPRLVHSDDESPRAQAEVYLVLSDAERSKGFVRPYRTSYVHKECGAVTRMGVAIAETYARNPKFYSGTYCIKCCMHRPLSEFVWEDGSQVGS
jgi:hypothetical protein